MLNANKELINALTPKKFWGKWDIDFNDALQLSSAQGFFKPEELQYIRLRTEMTNDEARKVMGKSPRTMYHYQTSIFWKYHYALYLDKILNSNKIIEDKAPAFDSDSFAILGGVDASDYKAPPITTATAKKQRKGKSNG